MNRAVISKVLPATDTKGTRIACVFMSPGETVPRKVFPWNYAYSAPENHALAVYLFLNLQKELFGVSASAPLGAGKYVHVVRTFKRIGGVA
jgi:hypothetical protein